MLKPDWYKNVNPNLDRLAQILGMGKKPSHGYTIAEKAPEVVTAPGVYFPAEKGKSYHLSQGRVEGGYLLLGQFNLALRRGELRDLTNYGILLYRHLNRNVSLNSGKKICLWTLENLQLNQQNLNPDIILSLRLNKRCNPNAIGDNLLRNLVRLSTPYYYQEKKGEVLLHLNQHPKIMSPESWTYLNLLLVALSLPVWNQIHSWD